MDDFREHPSLAGAWNGEEYRVDPNARDADSDVWFVVPPDPDDAADKPRMWEALRARKVASDVHEICASPVFLEGVAYGDQFTTMTMDDGVVLPTGLSRASGMSSGQVWLGDRGQGRWFELAVELAKVGCVVDVYTEKLMGISWPATVNDAVTTLMEKEESVGETVFAWAPSRWRPSA